MKRVKFYKMHGIGNDYIYFDCIKESLQIEKLAPCLSDRHFGIGGDGVILLCPSRIADIKMRMFNADGSEGAMCGNGIRCLAKLAYNLGYIKGDTCTVETPSGIKKLQLIFDKFGELSSIRVDMGAPVLSGKEIPSLLTGEKIVGMPVEIDGAEYKITLVNMGNPHCVIFTDPDTVDITLGRKLEESPLFPDRVNTEFVCVTGANTLKMRVWERGSGETLACGTGACAVAVASVLNGFCDKDKPIEVSLLGGKLKIEYSDTVYMTGSATYIYTGEIEIQG